MTRLRMALALACAIGIGAALGHVLTSDAHADALRPPPTCAAWESVERSHGSARCVPRACRRARECGAGTSDVRRVCMANVEEWASQPGPCRDRDGDGECDRRRVTVRREQGACDARGRCEVGSCVSVGTCRAP